MQPGTIPAERVIEVRGVSKYFGDVSALSKVSLRIASGESLLIYGPNGAGKTTLLRILARLTQPSEGEIALDGVPVERNSAAYKRKIGFVSHATFLYDDLTVRENLRLAGKLFGVRNLEAAIDSALGLFSLQDRAADLTRTLSRGLQQRVTLSRALLHDPDFLLLDEPFTGLDASSATALETLLRQLPEQGKALVFSTHNFAQGASIAARLVGLEQGKLRYDGAVADAPWAGSQARADEMVRT
jgi:heme exporter protein A